MSHRDGDWTEGGPKANNEKLCTVVACARSLRGGNPLTASASDMYLPSLVAVVPTALLVIDTRVQIHPHLLIQAVPGKQLARTFWPNEVGVPGTGAGLDAGEDA
jgi:hypothetical protein